MVYPAGLVLFMATHVVCNVMIVSMHGKINYNMLLIIIIGTVLITLGENCMIRGNAEVYESRIFLESCRKWDNNLERKKILKSLKPLTVKVGPFYFMKLSTFTEFMQIVVENTISVILTMKYIKASKQGLNFKIILFISQRSLD